MKIRNKIIAGFLGVNLILAMSGVVIGVVVSSTLKTAMIDITRTETASYVRHEANKFLDEDFFRNIGDGEQMKRYDSFLRSIKSDTIVRIKIWDDNFTVVYSNDPSIIGKIFPDNNELHDAYDNSIAINIKAPVAIENKGESMYEQLMEVYVPINYSDSTKVAGVVEVYYDMWLLNDRISDLKGRLALLISLILGFSIILSVLLSIFIGKKVSTPIAMLAAAVRRVADGKFDINLDIQSSDEIGMLSNEFVKMVRDLKALDSKVRKKTSEIEKEKKQVEKRVDELSRSNKTMMNREMLLMDYKKRITELEKKLNK